MLSYKKHCISSVRYLLLKVSFAVWISQKKHMCAVRMLLKKYFCVLCYIKGDVLFDMIVLHSD